MVTDRPRRAPSIGVVHQRVVGVLEERPGLRRADVHDELAVGAHGLVDGQLVRSTDLTMRAVLDRLTLDANPITAAPWIPPNDDDDDDFEDGDIGQPGGPPPLDGGALWDHRLGRSEIEDWPLTRAVMDAMQFRGVFGTETHAHRAGTLVLPTFLGVARVTAR